MRGRGVGPLPSLVRTVGTSTRVNKQAGGALLPSGANDSPQKNRQPQKQLLDAAADRQSPGDASLSIPGTT